MYGLFQVVGESGLFTPDDIAYVQEAGVKAVRFSIFIQSKVVIMHAQLVISELLFVIFTFSIDVTLHTISNKYLSDFDLNLIPPQVLVGESIVKKNDPRKGITELFGKDIAV